MGTSTRETETMLTAAILLLPCLAVVTGNGAVIVGKDIDPSCEGDACGTLYLLTDSDEEAGLYKGTHEKVKVKDVKKARVVGLGCFKIFKSRNFKSSAFLVNSQVDPVQPRLRVSPPCRS